MVISSGFGDGLSSCSERIDSFIIYFGLQCKFAFTYKNSNSLLSKSEDKISITYQDNSQGSISDSVYIQLYEPNFTNWIPEVNRISDDWYMLNYALRKVPYMDSG